MRGNATEKEDRAEHVQRFQHRHVSSITVRRLFHAGGGYVTAAFSTPEAGTLPPPPVYSCSVPDDARGQAEVLIPSAWLLPNLSLDAVRALQRGDTTSDLEKGDLRLAGVEVLIARNWVKEEFWPRIQDAVQKGYAAEKTYTFMRAHADRRGSRRPKK